MAGFRKKKKEEEHLRLQVQNLQKELAQKTFPAPDDAVSSDKSCGVILRVRQEKVNLIKSEMIDGHKYLIIPVEENEQVNLNGIDTEI